MFFKQLRIFKLPKTFKLTPESLSEKLAQLAFSPCLPSLPASQGWINPIEPDNESLVFSVKGCMLICLQIEEKVLPQSVIRQTLNEKITELEQLQHRKIRTKEKQSLKDDVIHTLLPRAFSKFCTIHGYIDPKNRWLIINSNTASKIEIFIKLLQRATELEMQPLPVKKPGLIMTHWLLNNSYPSTLGIEKNCVLQDTSQENRVIRCQQQNLFAESILALVKDGCQVKQLALNWYDRVSFILTDDFTFKSIHYADELIEAAKESNPETKAQQIAASFMIMVATIEQLLTELIHYFAKDKDTQNLTSQVAQNIVT